MSLYVDMMTDCVRMARTVEPDGEGGRLVTWEEDEAFKAAIYRESTLNNLLAEKQGMTDVYIMTVPIDVQIGFHEVIRRCSDGKTFRAMASTADRHTPTMASFQFARVAMQEWELDGEEDE